MAITTTYRTVELVAPQRVNVTTASYQFGAQAVFGPGGGVLFYADFSTDPKRILARSLDANGAGVGAETVVATGLDGGFDRVFSTAKLSNGNIVVVWNDPTAGDLHFRIYAPDMSTVLGDTVAESSPAIAVRPHVAATANGGFVIAWENATSDGDVDILFRRFDAAGASPDPISGVVVDAAGDNARAAVAVLTNGTLAFAYDKRVAPAVTEIRAAVFGADGAPVVPAFTFDNFGAVNRDARILARADGGFIVNYLDDDWSGSDIDVTTAVFSGSGAYQTSLRASATPSYDQLAATALSPDGFQLVMHTRFETYDTLATLIDPAAVVLFRDEVIRGDGAGGGSYVAESAQWIDGSRILFMQSPYAPSPGGDGSSSAVETTIRQVERVTTGDGAANTISFPFDGLRNVVNAGAGADTVTTGREGDLVNGEDGDDVIDAGAGADVVNGGAGADSITGGPGDDALNGGDGDDSFLIAGADIGVDQFNGGAGLDALRLTGDATLSRLTLNAPASVERIAREAAGFTLDGTAGDDFFNISGVTGYLTIAGGSTAAIVISLGAGADIFAGGAAGDVVNGGADGDNLNGGGGDDVLNGDAGADTIRGGSGNDAINGGEGGDTLSGESGLDTIYGGAGDDYLQDDSGASSILAGEAGNDQIYGGAGNDYVVGGDGDDVMVGLGGQDSLYGGAGADYIVAGNGVGSVVDGGAGANTLWGAGGADYMVGGEGADLLVGGAGSDYQFGNAGADTHYGGQGTDFLYTNAGNDFVWTDDVGLPQSTDYVYAGGGTGVDTIADFKAGAGANHDVLVVSPASGVASFAQVKANMTQVGVYTVLKLGADQVYLYNVQPFQLTADNFLFL